jgi:hypothetical protein
MTQHSGESYPMFALPKGQLLDNGDGTLVARVRASRTARREMRDWFARLAESRPKGVLAPGRLVDGQHGFEIHYEPQPRDAVSVSEVVARWQADPAASITVALELGRFVFGVVSELAGRGFADVLVAMATVRLVPGSLVHWRLVPVPTRGTSLADWARADPDTFLWSTPEFIVSGAAIDPVYVLGAVLHHALAGPPVPGFLSNRGKFARLLRGRAGLPARLGTCLRGSLPRSLEEDVATLEQLILDCLEPVSAARPSAAVVRQRLEFLADRLGTERLIRYWGFENQPAIVARLSALLPRHSSPPGAAAPSTSHGSTPAPPASWDEQVPILVQRGDIVGALEAAWNDIHENGPARIRFYLAVVQRMAARAPGPSADVRNALDRLVDAVGGRLDESDVLRLAHIRMRYLGDRTNRLGVSHRKFESRWNGATAGLMQARLLLTTGHAYNQVSRLCKESLCLYESMPEKGGRAGLYATAYLALLDGVANIGAVSIYKSDSFYNDAFEAIARSLDLAIRANHDGLIQSCLHWFGWLSNFTATATGPPLSILSKGIDAVLRSHGLSRESMAAAGAPEIPWYDELQLFPV